MAALDEARFTIQPSIWYEGCPRTIIEAFSHGKPVIASNLGVMADQVTDGKTGLLFSPGDANELAQKVRCLWSDPDTCMTMGLNGRQEYLARYTPEVNYKALLNIYEEAIRRKKR
jgi:glycosyltransferase involved in cell wall biosynthesis